jgi:hypothetical protein
MAWRAGGTPFFVGSPVTLFVTSCGLPRRGLRQIPIRRHRDCGRGDEDASRTAHDNRRNRLRRPTAPAATNGSRSRRSLRTGVCAQGFSRGAGDANGSHAAVAGGEPGVHRELQRHPVAPAYRVEHPLEERTCVVCGRPFTKRPNALVCGEECRRKRKMEQRKRRGPWRERSPDGVGGSPAVRSECAAVRGSLAMKAVSGDSLRPAAGAAGVPDSRGCSPGHHPRPRGRLARPKR